METHDEEGEDDAPAVENPERKNALALVFSDGNEQQEEKNAKGEKGEDERVREGEGGSPTADELDGEEGEDWRGEEKRSFEVDVGEFYVGFLGGG